MAGIDSFTKLCTHTDSDFSDSSASAHTATLHNTPTIDTTNKKFGAGSGLFASASSQSVDYGDSTDWAFGTGDFTIDLWVRFNSFPLVNVFVDMDPVADELDLDYFNTGTVLRLALHGVRYTFAWTPSTATWYHVAVSRSGTSLKAFIDGSQIGTTQTSSDNVGHTTLYVGAYSNAVSFHDGNIEELRISKGIARWTANFTPPTSAYSVDSFPSMWMPPVNQPYKDKFEMVGY